ncbi:hypothetical protein CALCODRAFT_483600, partial [Calocera cornea HHB12733]
MALNSGAREPTNTITSHPDFRLTLETESERVVAGGTLSGTIIVECFAQPFTLALGDLSLDAEGRRASKSPGPSLPILVLTTTGVLAAAVVVLAAAALPAAASAPVPASAAASAPARSPAIAALTAAPSRLRTSIWRASASSRRGRTMPTATFETGYRDAPRDAEGYDEQWAEQYGLPIVKNRYKWKPDAPRPNFTGHRHLTLYER